MAAREAASAPSAAARRIPNSSTGRPWDASTIRAALVATRVAKLSWLSSGVSSSWAAARGPSTTVIGVFGWTTRPSATASRRRPGEVDVAEPVAEGVVEETATGPGPWDRRASTSAGVARTDVIHEAKGPSPAATQ